MMFGADYPHHEGTWGELSTQDYLQATFGAAHVPVEEARLMLGDTAATVYGADVDKLARLAAKIGPDSDEILNPPFEEKFPRGDVLRPFADRGCGC
jgi:hypothetical protein